MYIEFIIGYVISAFIVVLLLAVLVLQIVILKKISRKNAQIGGSCVSNEYARRTTAICSNCATRFDTSYNICPKCGTPR